MKRITIAEAYRRLSARRRDDETFSDVILRLSDRRPLSDFAGILNPRTAEKMRGAIEESRRERDVLDRSRIELIVRAISESDEDDVLETVRRKARRAGLTRKRVQEFVDEARDEVWKKRYRTFKPRKK